MRNGRNIAGTILGAAAVAVILVCLCVSAGISKAKRAKTLCSGTEVEIADSAENRFVSEADILEYMEKDYGKTEGIPIEDIDLKKMEDILDSQSAVLKSEAYCTKDGILHVKITQRIPVMRFQKNGRRFYGDANGYVFPIKEGKASHVIVIDGNIPIEMDNAGKGRAVAGEEKEWMERMTEMVLYMEKHKIWSRNIVQIHVLGNGDMVLIPRDGTEKFLFGKPTDIEEKFALMESYYTGVVPAKGKDRYRSVDVRYRGQVICK